MQEIDQYNEAEQRRNILRRVVAYRDLCNHVRSSSMGTLIMGAIMLAIWYALIPEVQKTSFYGLIFLCLALLEFGTGILNRFFPSAEGVLLEGLVLICFGAWSVGRQLLIMQGMVQAGAPSAIFVMLGVWWLIKGVQQARSYFTLRQLFADRPTKEHIRWFDNLVRELYDADPRTDPQALVLPTDPPMSAKLVGDTAFLVFPSGEVEIVGREELVIELLPQDESGRQRGYLLLRGRVLPPFPLSQANWRNYLQWKEEGVDELPEAHPV